MPFVSRILKKFQRQTLVYWQRIDSDPQGQAIFAPPVELPCRWENKIQEIILPNARKVNSKGYLLMAVNIVPGSLVFQGTLADVAKISTYPERPLTNNQGAREILYTRDTPDLKNQDHLYEVYF